MKIIKLLVLIVCFLNLKCEKEDSSYNLSSDILSLVSSELLDKMISEGMIINEGSNPPCIEGDFLASPFKLISTSVTNDVYSPGAILQDYSLRLYNQNIDSLIIDIDYINGPESGNGRGGYIAGENNDFTIFTINESTISGETSTTVFVISGSISSNGIENFHAAGYMIENNGFENLFIPNGTGRIFIDSSPNKMADCTSTCATGC